MATDRSTEGMPVYPKAAPPSRVVRGEELQDLFRAVKGAFHDPVSSSCTSGTTTGKPLVQPQRIGTRWRIPHEPDILGGPGSIAVISGSGSYNTTTPEGGNAAGSSSPESESSPSDTAIDIWSSEGAPKETYGAPRPAEGPAHFFGSSTGCGVLEGGGAPLGEAGCRDERWIAAEAEGLRHV